MKSWRGVVAIATLCLSVTMTDADAASLRNEGAFPPLSGAVEWINSPPLSPDALRGKVVLVNVWTYSCINSLRPMPYLRAWADKYQAAGLVVVGVHSPEFQFETVSSNVHRAVMDYHVDFPVAVDSDFRVWRAFNNHYWPAFYFVDARGRVRYHQFGEGDYATSEQVIQQLLVEAGATNVPTGIVAPLGKGVEAPPGPRPAVSQETYLGYENATSFASPGGAVRDKPNAYAGPSPRRVDQWTLAGEWTIERERAVSLKPGGRIALRFDARDVHLVLGPLDETKPVRFRVLIDGKPPGADHGTDVDEQGVGTVNNHRLYQLVRQGASTKDRTVEIEFMDPGALAYVFTFG